MNCPPLDSLPLARWFICCEGELHSIRRTVFAAVMLRTFPVLERPASLQSSPHSSIQPHLTGKIDKREIWFTVKFLCFGHFQFNYWFE